MITADLHIHTCYSHDSCTRLGEIVERCVELGLGCVAITDHGTIEGAIELQKIAPFRVIVGAEILTPVGEIMGLFLKEDVPGGLSPLETVARIKKQGALAGIPHPFGRWPIQNSHKLLSPELIEQMDFLEVFNARSPFARSSDRAQQLALKYGKAGSAGSDAHTPGEIGKAYVEMRDFDGVGDFLEALASGRVHGERSSNLVHFASTLAKIRKKLC
ncbi:MAG: PHP domain-containing protein [Chloroflexota bacterium]